MKIERALREDMSSKGELSYKTDKMKKTKIGLPPFKKPVLFCCSNCDKKFREPLSSLRLMTEFTLVRNHSAAQSVTRHSQHQVI